MFRAARKAPCVAVMFAMVPLSSATSAQIFSAIDVSGFGNTAERLVAVRMPRGTRVYDGKAQGMERGPIGGGSQVVVDGVRIDWEVKP